MFNLFSIVYNLLKSEIQFDIIYNSRSPGAVGISTSLQGASGITGLYNSHRAAGVERSEMWRACR